MAKTEFIIGQSKKEWAKKDVAELKTLVEKDAWIALKQYFDNRGNGTEAKVAVGVLGSIGRFQQAENNKRQLDLVEKKLLNK